MKMSLILFGLLILLDGFLPAGAGVVTHNIYVTPPGASVHEIIVSPSSEDYWTDGSGITYTHYENHDSIYGWELSWSDISFQFNLAELKGSTVKSARLNIKTNWAAAPSNTTVIATLNHYGGFVPPTGNAQNDRLIGSDYLWSFYKTDVGNNHEIDVTSQLRDDLAKGCRWAVFSLNHATTSGTNMQSPIWGAEGFSNVLIVEAVPGKPQPAIDLLLLGD